MQYRNDNYASGVWDTYFYEKNLQGDIVSVYSSSGTKLVSYTYDAWGKITATTYSNGGANTSARYNPIKYRGYYYDDDLDLYYLATRYYDPETCRFITADSYVSTGRGILGYNRYAYCNNNPVMYVDPSGEILIDTFLVYLTIGVASGFVLSWLLDGMTEDDSIEVQLDNKTNDYGVERYGYFDLKIEDIDIFGSKEAVAAKVELGAIKTHIDFDDLNLDVSVLTAEAGANGLGGSAGVYLYKMGFSHELKLFGEKKVAIGLETNYGAGVQFELGSKTRIGATAGIGFTFVLDWEP